MKVPARPGESTHPAPHLLGDDPTDQAEGAVGCLLVGINPFNGKSRAAEISKMLAISQRAAYNLCNSTTEFRVLRAGGSIRIPKDSFDAWLYRAA